MSLYNMIHGVNPATYMILPMLGKHPDEYPRFRDCFLGDESNQVIDKIIIYTRTGGGNRDHYIEENHSLTQIDGYIKDYDDDFDNTFANFVYEIPERFKDDLLKIKEGNLKETSEDYKKQVLSVFPKIEEQLKNILY